MVFFLQYARIFHFHIHRRTYAQNEKRRAKRKHLINTYVFRAFIDLYIIHKLTASFTNGLFEDHSPESFE